ncbi:Sensor protein FixL [Methylobrevis pamukkalensis]|uniref:histidine kinase n=1 Tax=Methylobrevis pamukkalensis TaxID=1439726 RepID=A0A1E3H4B3_9HYPH|nr:Sensor protein FixL [Methylobrevis pamukkalensis]
MIEVALDAVITVDADCRVVDFNPAAEHLFAYETEAVRGREIGDIIVPPTLREAHRAGVERYRRTGIAHVLGRRVELEAMRSDGSIIPIELQIHAIDGVEGVRYAAYVRDLTQARRTAREIAEQREKLHQAEKLSAMGSLLASLAHELNNPLAIVVAQATLIDEMPEDRRNPGRIAKVRSAAERCGRIVRTFLSMVRQQKPSRAQVSIETVVAKAMEIGAYGARSAGITVIPRHGPDVPDVEADEDQITQVLINLVLNAQQAFPPDDRERCIWIETRRADDGVHIVVADNGPGVPPDLRPRIFEAFFTTKPAGAGTGIGLAVCRNIVEAHGGRIEVGERPGGGALFRIVLPVGASSPKTEAGEAITAGRPLSILVVDDEADVGGTLAEILDRDGHRVTLAVGPAAALDLVGHEHFDMVFCDLHMPGGGGTALHAELTLRAPDLARRFVFVTGDMVAGPARIARALADAAPPVVAKPFGRDDVRAAIATVFAEAAE